MGRSADDADGPPRQSGGRQRERAGVPAHDEAGRRLVVGERESRSAPEARPMTRSRRSTASPFPVASASMSVSQGRVWIVQPMSSSLQTARAISTLKSAQRAIRPGEVQRRIVVGRQKANGANAGKRRPFETQIRVDEARRGLGRERRDPAVKLANAAIATRVARKKIADKRPTGMTSRKLCALLERGGGPFLAIQRMRRPRVFVASLRWRIGLKSPPRKPASPTRRRAGRREERLPSRGLRSIARSLRPLPPELQIVSDAGVPLEQILATVLRAPAGVSPLQALFAADVIGEEPYYRALAERLGCRYYLGSPHFAEDFDTAKGLRSGVAPLAEGYGAPRAVIAPNPAVTAQLLEATFSGRLRPESFVVTSPKRFAAQVRAQCPRQFSTMRSPAFPKSSLRRAGPLARKSGSSACRRLAAVFSEISVQSLSMITSTRCGSCSWRRSSCVRLRRSRTPMKSAPHPF